jgi:replicative DNA helicase
MSERFEDARPIGRTLPHSVDGEEYLLSCILLDESTTLGRCIDAKVTPFTFYVPANIVIYETLVAMFADGKKPDLAVLAEELKRKKLLEGVGGYAYLTQISSCIPTTAQADYFIKTLRDLEIKRRVIKEATGLVESAYTSTGDIGELLSSPVERFLSMLSSSDGMDEPIWPVVVDRAVEAAESLILNSGLPADRTIEFPWPAMNELFGPMERGQFNLIAARTSIGKSSLVRPIAAHAARQGKSVYFVTLEVNPQRVALQLASLAANVGIRALHRAHPRDQDEFRAALLKLKEMKMTVSRRDRNLARIVARARALKAKGKLDLLVVDHGGLLDEISGSSKNDLIQNCSRFGKTLKNLAGELDCVVLGLWQLSRGPEKEKNREPIKSDLRDSGTLEEDCDKLLLIHRPDTDPITKMEQHETSPVSETPLFFQNVIQAKGRDEGTSCMSFYFRRETTTFTPATIER